MIFYIIIGWLVLSVAVGLLVGLVLDELGHTPRPRD
jgi:hypothetical protein